MKKTLISIHILYIFLLACGSVFGIGERTLPLGGEAAWRLAENRSGVTEAGSIRPHSVLVLSSASSIEGYQTAAGTLGLPATFQDEQADLWVSFDEADARFFKDIRSHYIITVMSNAVTRNVEAADRRFARAGSGAALFGGSPLVIEPVSRNALFASGNNIKDFTIEFWIYPLNLGNGEQILNWNASKLINGNFAEQQIQCSASANRLKWSFDNFFAAPSSENGAAGGGAPFLNIEISGSSYIVPKTWSHHLIRFDASTGMLEYLVDGKSEAICYATSTGHEAAGFSSDVYTPAVGSDGAFVIGENFTGMMDELKIHSVFASRSSIQKYALAGGRAETAALELGDTGGVVQKVNVSGGRTSIKNARISNEFRESGSFRFSDDSQINFFIRSGDNPWLMNENQWIAFSPGETIKDVKGRFVQLAFDFYPSGDGETSPYLDEVRVIYSPNEPPLPPRNFTAVASNGEVLLQWAQSSDENIKGYLIYYSSVRDELFGVDAAQGASPIDAANKNSILLDGLKNGTLYYFRIASYDYANNQGERNIGEFSREITARPLEGLPRNR